MDSCHLPADLSGLCWAISAVLPFRTTKRILAWDQRTIKWPIPPEFPLTSVLPDSLPKNWASILGLLSGSGDPPLTSCVALGKSLNLSDPQHPPLKMRIAVTIQPDEVVSTLGHPVSVALVNVRAPLVIPVFLALTVPLLHFSLQTSTTITRSLNIMRPRAALFSRTSIPATAHSSTSATFRTWL